MFLYRAIKNLFFCFFMLLTCAVADPLPLIEITNKVELANNTSIYRTFDNDMSVYDVRELADENWSAVNTGVSGIPNYGYIKDVAWFRFTVSNQGEFDDWLIEVADPLVDQLSIYVYQDERLIDDYITGDSNIFYLRRIPHRNFLYPLQLKQGEEVTVYIRMKSTSPIFYDVNLWSTDEFFYADQYSLLGQSFYFGAMMVMAAFNLMIYLFIRDNTYLYYVGFVSAQAMFYLAIHGYGYQTVWSFSPWFQQYAIIFFLNTSIATGLLFWNQFIGVYKYAPKIAGIIKVAAYTLVGLLFCTLFVPYKFIIIPSIVLSLSSLSIILTASFSLVIKRNRISYFILFSWLVFIVGGLFFTLSRLGFIPYTQFTNYAFQISMLIEVIILSVAIADNINSVRQEKMLAQQEALSLQREYNERLERSVNVRTRALEEANNKLSAISETDALTGVKNRRGFDQLYSQQYESCIRQKKPISVIMVDIDHFKLINDRYGHLVGDDCLRLVGGVLQKYIYRETDMITRYGGEEFAITLASMDMAAAKAKAEELCCAIRNIELVVEGGQVPITASLGVASHIPADISDSAKLIALADQALYEAKNSGRDQVCINDV